jgi:DNA-binding response OmpR family regulator
MPEKSKVLIVDDDPDILLLTAVILREEGYQVLEAETGSQCLELAGTHRPDLVLVDVMLPDMTGLEVCRQIKTDQALQGIFVILVSGLRVSPDFQAEGLDAGADGYLIKPLTNREFLARINSMARIKQVEDALREKEKEQQKLILQLRQALAEIKTLKGFLPICASCKKIRDDRGYWNQLEVYISQHTDAIFSHGLCPECAEKYRAEMDDLLHEEG